MENQHHEDPQPTNKWVATPIVMAFLFISVVIFFISLAAKGKGKDAKTQEHGTEQHDATNTDEHGEVKTNETAIDTSKVTADTTSAINGQVEHGH